MKRHAFVHLRKDILVQDVSKSVTVFYVDDQRRNGSRKVLLHDLNEAKAGDEVLLYKSSTAKWRMIIFLNNDQINEVKVAYFLL